MKDFTAEDAEIFAECRGKKQKPQCISAYSSGHGGKIF
jgi:hypothetical protein